MVATEEELKRAPLPPRESAPMPPVAEDPAEVNRRHRWVGQHRPPAEPMPPRESMPVPSVAESPVAVDPVPAMGGPASPARRAGGACCRVDGVGPARVCPVTGRTRRQTGNTGNHGIGRRWIIFGTGICAGRGGPVQADEYQRRIARLTETQQPVLVSLAVAVSPASNGNTLRAAGQSQLVVVSGNPPALRSP